LRAKASLEMWLCVLRWHSVCEWRSYLCHAPSAALRHLNARIEENREENRASAFVAVCTVSV
jgi:hypothetical protein